MRSIEQLELLEELILDGTRVPFSSGRLVNEQEAIQVIAELRSLIPREIKLANEIMNNNNKYLQSAKDQAKSIIKEAEVQRLNLISSSAVKKEAERQISQLRKSAESDYADILRKAANKQKEMDRIYKDKSEILEAKYNSRSKSLSNSFDEKRLEMESVLLQEHKTLKNKLAHEIKQLNEQINDLNQTKIRIEKDLEERYNKSISQINTKLEESKIYCDQIISSSKKEADKLKSEAYDYVKNILHQLNSQITTIASSVNQGMTYLDSNQFELKSTHKTRTLKTKAYNLLGRLNN